MKKAESKKKKISPSSERYDRKRPTFSFRNYEELNERINKVKKAEGISNTNILEAAVGLFEVKIRKEKEIRDQAFTEGYDKGVEESYELAESRYKVMYPCSVCGKPIELDTPEEKEAASTYMREHGWGHAECHKQRQQL